MSVKRMQIVHNPHRLLTPGSVVVISVGDGQQDNLFTIAWNMALRKTPPMAAILTGKRHYSYPFLEKTGEFGINIFQAEMAPAVLGCGKVSGHDLEDKFATLGLQRTPAEHIKAPLVREAIATLECRISHVYDMGASALVMAQILQAQADPRYFHDGDWDFSGDLQLLHHLGGNRFAISERAVEIDQN